MLEGQGSSRMQPCCFVRLSSMFVAHVLLLSSESGIQVVGSQQRLPRSGIGKMLTG